MNERSFKCTTIALMIAIGTIALGGCNSSSGGATSTSGGTKSPAATKFTNETGQPLPPSGQTPPVGQMPGAPGTGAK